MVAHVCDFGIAKLLGVEGSNAQTQTLATIGYMAPEYGSEGIVSTSCDIYSFGIMMMETFMRKKPTDEMFSENLTIKDWISGLLLPDARIQTIDANLIRPEEDNYDGKVHCFSSILELALQCSSDSPEERLNIGDVLTSLHKLRANLLKNTSKAKS